MNTPKVTRVLAIHAGKRDDPGACELYRITTPLYYLDQRPGWNCKWISFIQFYEDYLKINPDDNLKYIAANFDLVVWARTQIQPSMEGFASAAWTIQRLRELGVRQIYEIDDDYSNDYRYVAFGDAMTFASWCDAVTVTTPHLAETMRRQALLPTHIMPNMLDPQFWKNPSSIPPDLNFIHILISGSTTHVEDWRVLGEVLPKIAADYPQVRVLVGCFHPDYLRNIPNAEYIPPLPYAMYIDLVKAADIVLCPVDPTDQFNLGKSPIKATEGQGATRLVDGEAMGAAVIATDNPIYRLAIPNDKVGVLVKHTPAAWDAAIRELIENTAKRRSLQRQGYKFVWKNFNLETGWTEWAQAYNRVLTKPVNAKKIDYGKAYTTYRESTRMSNGAARQH